MGEFAFVHETAFGQLVQLEPQGQGIEVVHVASCGALGVVRGAHGNEVGLLRKMKLLQLFIPDYAMIHANGVAK